ncbi:hypothetical protein Mgra_00006068 [Meloidogyne graminicola]|uniref:Tudor domain-containing protein n=1 Tax=Meloidogyne graminicola TaxID=189291 RepID=A0A8S9ZM20_9BILA|nr:hypothetical protein Mgra_00006068 [Meloidogyne graminicola]
MLGNNYKKHDLSKLRNDAFWEFLFSKHPFDELRRTNLYKLISLFDGSNSGKFAFNNLNKLYYKNFGEYLTPRFLRELFCTRLMPEGYECEVFRYCGRMFALHEPNIISLIIDESSEEKNIFVSSTPSINAEGYRNVKLADQVFEILPQQRKIPLTDVVSFFTFKFFHLFKMKNLMNTKEYNEIKGKSSPDTPHLEPIKFTGFLHLYWNDVFKLTPDIETGEIWIKRHVLRHQKPSQEKKYMKEILTTLPRFPLPSDILTSPHVVRVSICKLPTDGVGLQILELNDDFSFVHNELKEYHEEVSKLRGDEEKAKKLHPNDTFEGSCCLYAHFSENGKREFRRCIITGQSNGLAMVQDVDYPWVGLVELRNLYQIPRHLVGIRQTCVYGVFAGFNMKTKNERTIWDGVCREMCRSNVRNVCTFHRPAERIDYSGRKKYSIFQVTIQVNEIGTSKPLICFPGSF